MSRPAGGESLETVARLLDLVPFITANQGISLENLSKEFSISPTQMTQDLNTLWMCGLPGYTPYELIDLSFDTGFVTISNAETLQHPRSLSRAEVLALLLGLESLSEELKAEKSGVLDVLNVLISRLSKLMGARVAAQVQAGDPSSGLVLRRLEDAIRNRESLSLRYHSVAKDEVTDREIVPIEIIEDQNLLYLVAFCFQSGGYRTFRIDRIDGVHIQKRTTAPIISLPDPGETSKIRVHINVKSRQRDVAERFRPEEIGPSRPTQTMIFNCFNQEWAVREIMSFGGAVAALAPVTLKNAVAERSRRTLSEYSADF